MNEHIWEILKTEKTTDVAVIKRAYAARAKECHPEEHPEEFKQLQRAYREAVAWAKEAAETPQREAVEWMRAVENAAAPQQQKTVETPQQEAVEWTRARGAAPPPDPETAGTGEEAAGSPGFTAVTDAVREAEKQGRKERLAEEMWLAVKNPYLQNCPAYWRHLFAREEYRELFADAAFMGKMARILARQGGWYRSTIRMIGRRLAPEDPGLRWKWLLHRPYDKPPLAEGVSSTKLIQIHGMLLGRIRETGVSDDIEHDKEAMACYLEQYLAFADHNAALLDRCGRNIRITRVLALALFFAGLTAVTGMMFAGRVSERGGVRPGNGPGSPAGQESAGEERPGTGSGQESAGEEKPGNAGEKSGAASGAAGAKGQEDPPAVRAGSDWNQERLDGLMKEFLRGKAEE